MKNNFHVVIVDDDVEICTLLKDFLTNQQFKVSIAHSAANLMDVMAEHTDINLIVLDLMLPDNNGLEICKQLHKQSHKIPIIMLTAVHDDMDKILSLEIGADDYLTKPFNPRELVARIKAVLRRSNGTDTTAEVEIQPDYKGQLLKFSGWTLNAASRQLFSPDNIEVALNSKGYDLLLAFLEHPQRVLSRDQLLTILSNRMAEPFDRSIDVQVSRLRQKLGDDPKEPKIIKTVRAGGYLFAATVKRA